MNSLMHLIGDYDRDFDMPETRRTPNALAIRHPNEQTETQRAIRKTHNEMELKSSPSPAARIFIVFRQFLGCLFP